MLRTVPQQAIRAQRVFMRHAATSSTTPMLCMQCEQTEGNVGCTTVGVCGKTPEAAAVQDLLVEAVRAASQLALTVPTTPEEDHLVLEAMFSTLTNVNFDVDALAAYVVRMDDMVTRMKAAAPGDHGVAFALEGKDAGSMILQGLRVGVTARQSKAPDADIFSLQELITYGCKGMAAYAHHADALGMRSADVQRVLYEAMAMTNSSTVAAGDLVGMALKVGEANVTTMAMLSDGHKARFGVPEPSPVSLRPTAAGKCVLVSGHDIADLEAVLKAAEGTDVGVYTHGELLPAHGYPSIKSHPNLRGNYGGAWQNQKVDFAEFPGPILMTTNCLVEPRKSYADRTYTCNAVGFEGIKHVKDRDFAPMIAQAQAMEGFTEDDIEDAAENAEGDATSMTGFGHDAVLGIADQVIGAIDSGKLRHIFFVGGCDGSEGERNYFRDFALGLPDDTVVLTAGCGKYRFNKEMERMGAVPGTGLPRMLDMGQCNDSYSAVKVALALAEHYKTDVNSLPLSLVVSWFEQKAVAVLLSLLHLGVQDIRLGPNLPAFISPGVLGVLVENFAIKPCSPNADTDIATILSPPAQEEARA